MVISTASFTHYSLLYSVSLFPSLPRCLYTPQAIPTGQCSMLHRSSKANIPQHTCSSRQGLQEFHNLCEKHLFPKPCSILSAACLDGCVGGLQWCNSLKTKHEWPWKDILYYLKPSYLPDIFHCKECSPHLHFCPGKVLPSVWNCLPHFPPPQHSSFSLVRGKGGSLAGTGAIWLRAAIILGIFCQSINTTALGRIYAKEISELQLLPQAYWKAKPYFQENKSH